MYPWELTPSLQEDRLLVLARVAVETRNKVFAEANRDEGDTNWGLGCRAHERLGHALARLEGGGEHPWLTVNRDGLYIMPIVDGIPIRVYRGSPDKPGARNLDAVRAEYERSKPKQTAFFFMDAPAVEEGLWLWLMALETDVDGKVLRAVFFQANEAGETRYPWSAPLGLEGTDASLASADASADASVVAAADEQQQESVAASPPRRLPRRPSARRGAAARHESLPIMGA